MLLQTRQRELGQFVVVEKIAEGPLLRGPFEDCVDPLSISLAKLHIVGSEIPIGDRLVSTETNGAAFDKKGAGDGVATKRNRSFGFSFRQNELVIRRDAQAVTFARVKKRHFLACSHEIAHIDLSSRGTREPLGMRARDNSIRGSAHLMVRHWHDPFPLPHRKHRQCNQLSQHCLHLIGSLAS